MKNNNKKRCKFCGYWIGHDENCTIAFNCVHCFTGLERKIKVFGLKRKIKIIQCIHCGLVRTDLMKPNEDTLKHQI